MNILDVLFTSIMLVAEIIILWYWLRINQTTSGFVKVQMVLKKISKLDIIFNSFWIVGYLLLPFFYELSITKETKTIGLFFTNLLFGKFFWDSVLPSFELNNSLAAHIKYYLWGPIVNLLTGILVLKLLSYVFNVIPLIFLKITTEKDMNIVMNFIADAWPPFANQKYLQKVYEFSKGFSGLSMFIIFFRVFITNIKTKYKFLLFVGIFCLLNRTLKYSGNDFVQIMNLGMDNLKEEYSLRNFITILLGWLLALILKSKNE